MMWQGMAMAYRCVKGGWWWWLRRPRPPCGGGADVRAYIVGIESETFSSAVTFQLDVTVFHCV